MSRWRFAASIARRDLNRSLRGLRLLFLCIFLGVATLSTIGSLTAAITSELASRGQVLLGGDVQVSMSQRRASPEEAAAMRSAGAISETIRMRAMARRPDGGAAVLTELKGVDSSYPLYGTLTVGGRPSKAPPPGEILVATALAERLEVSTGDRVRYGEAEFRVSGIISDEPDRVGEGFTLGPVAIVSLPGLERTGLVQPGSLYVTKYRLRLPPGQSPESVVEDMRTQFPGSSWEFRDRDRAAPGANRFFERMGQFLTLTGLAALIIAGIGVSNGVSSYLRRKRPSIATMKALGATSSDIARIYFIQIGLVTLAAISAGLIIGALLPPVAIVAAGDFLPVKPGLSLHAQPLLLSAAYGLLIAFIFVLPPLSRARLLPVATLFRQDVGEGGRLDRPTWIAAAAATVMVIALAVGTSDQPVFSAGVLGSASAVILLLALVGWAVRKLARAAPRPKRPLLRLAITALHRPGSPTVALVVALGLALTLFVTLAAIQTSISAEIAQTVPERAPDQFVLDIPAEDRGRFEAMVEQAAPGAAINIVPTLRGTVTEVRGQPPSQKQRDQHRFLFGERGVTYSPTLPEGSTITAGSWWPSDYRGPPLVSLDAEAADVLGLKVGDMLTISILGREIEAHIASLRTIEWETMGFNYILVFSPSALESAPHNLAATVITDDSGGRAITRSVLAAFPSASVVDVGEIIDQVGTILNQMAAAILLAASVAIAAGIAVLIGALGASREAQTYDSIILKTLGATRLQILFVQALEYGLISLLVASLSLVLGLAGAWYVVVQLFEFGWRPDWAVVLATLGAGATLTIGIALAASLPLLSVRPAAALRDL
ncbi:FtsX-like permease family protein [soil metagenome]